MLGWPRQPRLFLGTRRQRDAGRGPRTPPSRDTLGCLFMGADDFVESQAGTGKCPVLHHQPEGGLGLCHPEKNSAGKTVSTGRELGASSLAHQVPSNTPLG